MVVRILIWSLYESQTSIEELRDALPSLEAPSTWIWSDGSERFGLVAYGDELPEAAGWAAELIGEEPAVYEEFEPL